MSYNTIDIKSSVQIEDVDEKGIVKIRVSTFGNVDSHNEIIDEKAFTRSINHFNQGGKTRIKHLKNHDQRQAIGKPLEIIQHKEGVDIVSRLNLDKQIGKDAFADYKFYAEEEGNNSHTIEHSVGYIPKIKQKSQELGAIVVKEAQLMEYSSLDFWGSNPITGLIGLKSMDMSPEELIKRIELLESKVSALDSLKSTQLANDEEENKEIKENQILLNYFKFKYNAK